MSRLQDRQYRQPRFRPITDVEVDLDTRELHISSSSIAYIHLTDDAISKLTSADVTELDLLEEIRNTLDRVLQHFEDITDEEIYEDDVEC